MIEDSDEDYIATARILNKSGYGLKLERTSNVEEAFDFLQERGKLRRQKKYDELPALILLDLNLPGADGRDFLVQLKIDEHLKEIPVVILTTSNNPRDILHCYRHGANGYQIKPVGFDKFRDSINSMIEYWFETATIPAAVI